MIQSRIVDDNYVLFLTIKGWQATQINDKANSLMMHGFRQNYKNWIYLITIPYINFESSLKPKGRGVRTKQKNTTTFP